MPISTPRVVPSGIVIRSLTSMTHPPRLQFGGRRRGRAMDVLIAGSLLSLVICVAGLLAEWRHIAARQRHAATRKPW
jgi:hypothetical protein